MIRKRLLVAVALILGALSGACLQPPPTDPSSLPTINVSPT
jgi:hypothetical protein